MSECLSLSASCSSLAFAMISLILSLMKLHGETSSGVLFSTTRALKPGPRGVAALNGSFECSVLGPTAGSSCVFVLKAELDEDLTPSCVPALKEANPDFGLLCVLVLNPNFGPLSAWSGDFPGSCSVFVETKAELCGVVVGVVPAGFPKSEAAGDESEGLRDANSDLVGSTGDGGEEESSGEGVEGIRCSRSKRARAACGISPLTMLWILEPRATLVDGVQ